MGAGSGAASSPQFCDDFSFTFPPDLQWVRSAREAVRTALLSVLPETSEVLGTAVLLTSEVVTNAVVASLGSARPAPVALYAAWNPAGAVRVLVHDVAPGAVEAPAGLPSPEAENGRGLLLLAHCAREWGVCRHLPGPGKAVWFCL
ncbi:ATP-binding protein [Streptomyces sp. ACA25]|uniref:ATP-binding protein n=1 Tax=Streptomyces sp. ACA25 TaxID=3022596 RepID=UPI0023078497|nr:ATP-binding protein [Streptomyces sp. ACA25]MDB1090225.1 ATP-binding protein [Streptomyces sp. ACA25]